MVYITRIEHFNAAHKLFNAAWSKEKNEEVFGKCANENWHGHNFNLHVTVKGLPSVETGFVFDAKKLSIIIKQYVTDLIDHKNLNVEVEFLKGKICSIENLVMGIWQQLQPQMPPNVSLHRVKLYETDKIYVEYFG
ncbi:MAG: 6-pyruvoyl trahydropterin synthase family protein [Ferruginibacter sp.]